MERWKERLMELVRVGVFGFAAFGVAMFLGFLLSIQEGLKGIPIVAVAQTLIYLGGITLAIIIWLTDIVTERLSQKSRIILFFGSLYVLGLGFFQYTAPNGPFNSFGYFFAFSLWLIQVSAIGFIGWLVYSQFINRKYQTCLEKYKQSLN